MPGARAATFTVVNLDGPGEGFNDPSPRPPAPGNPGTTLGAQRLFAFLAAAAADRLTSALFRDMGWRLIAGGGGGADDVIFSDDFETGDFRRWDAVR